MVTALAGVMIFTAIGCSTKEETAAVSVVDDGVLTVGMIDGGDVYARKDGADFVGEEADIMDILAGNLGIRVEYKEAGDVHELMALLDEGAVDLAAGGLTMTERYGESHLLSRNYGKKGLYLITEKSRYMDTLAGLDGGVVGISWQIPGTDALDIPYIGDLGQETYSDITQFAEDVKNRVILAGVCTEREALGLLEKDNEIQAVEIHGGPRVSSVFYLAPGQNVLLTDLNQAINSFLDQKAQEE